MSLFISSVVTSSVHFRVDVGLNATTSRRSEQVRGKVSFLDIARLNYEGYEEVQLILYRDMCPVLHL